MRTQPTLHTIAAAILFTIALAGSVSAQVSTSPSNRAYLGFQFQCSDCTIIMTDSVRSFTFSTPPVVVSMTQGGPAVKAGLQIGDSLTHVNGALITTEQGARRFAALVPNEEVRFTVRRGGATVQLGLTPDSLDETRAEYARALDGLTAFGRWDARYTGADSTYRRLFGNLMTQDSTMRYTTGRADSVLWRLFGSRNQQDSARWSAFGYQGARQNDSTLRAFYRTERVSGDWIGAARAFSGSSAGGAQFNGMFAGLSVTVTGDKPVTVSVVEPNCVLAIDVEGTRILVRSPSCGRGGTAR